MDTDDDDDDNNDDDSLSLPLFLAPMDASTPSLISMMIGDTCVIQYQLMSNSIVTSICHQQEQQQAVVE
jgi:hypothetical protein